MSTSEGSSTQKSQEREDLEKYAKTIGEMIACRILTMKTRDLLLKLADSVTLFAVKEAGRIENEYEQEKKASSSSQTDSFVYDIEK